MFFKNIRLYRFTKRFDIKAEELEEKLAAKPFETCKSFDFSRYGWVSPLGNGGEMLTHVLGGYIMLCGQKEEKILPASVIREEVEVRVADLEVRQGRKVYRKEKLQLKDDVTAALLPQAFSRLIRTFAYLAPKDGLLVINTTSAKKAEEFLTCLRDSIDSLPVEIPTANHAPSDVMTRWVKQRKASDHFIINQDCEFYNPVENSNIVRCKGQDMRGEEISAHLDAGKQIKKLGVIWNSSLSCILEDDLTIKRLRFDGIEQEKDRGGDAEPESQRFDQDFAIMTLELSRFFTSLFAAFGGIGSDRRT
ncbi:MAG: recombination-associated protein RdgC [Pseudohongiellaceae bacterium]